MGKQSWRGILILLMLVLAVSAWAMNVIQTQPSTDGNFELSLLRAKVKGDVLTIQVMFKNTSSQKRNYEFEFGAVYYTDAKEKKKYYGLKDSKGAYIAGPKSSELRGGVFNVWFEPNAKSIMWMKFPAPPETTQEIDIYIPWALPFEGVKVER